MSTTKRAGWTEGPQASRQGTWQETHAGPWIVSHEGAPVIKRELRFVEDDAPAGWELLSGDYSALADSIAAGPDLADLAWKFSGLARPSRAERILSTLIEANERFAASRSGGDDDDGYAACLDAAIFDAQSLVNLEGEALATLARARGEAVSQ